MVSTYSDFAPFVILLTLLLAIIIGRKIAIKDLKSIDGGLAVLGFVFGFLMTLLNLVYTSKDLFLLSPFIAISCISYLRYRSHFGNIGEKPVGIGNMTGTLLKISWWLLVSLSLLTLSLSEIYTRSPIFFLLISGAVALLSIQIVAYTGRRTAEAYIVIVKILLISIILRYSAFFISPYPVGSDAWVHREYIASFIDSGHITISTGIVQSYLSFPIAHLYGACASLVTSVSPLQSLFLIGVILTISSIFSFLIVRLLTGNVQLALFSMLLLTFADAYIQWSIQVIAMSFGIALFSIIIYTTLKIFINPDSRHIFFPLLLVFLSVIIWTHTISAFITLVALCALLIGYIFSEMLISKNYSSLYSRTSSFFISTIVIGTIILLYHWIDPAYPFLGQITERLTDSLSTEAAFLGGTSISNVAGRWEELLIPIGFCLYVFLGTIGALYCISENGRPKRFFPILSLVLVLFFVRYAFPIFGMRNIIPDRWPAFALVCFCLFVGYGILCGISLPKKRTTILCGVALFFFIGSFLMSTDSISNLDSPLYGGEIKPKLIWTESEMGMYSRINATYDGTIIADVQTVDRPFAVFLHAVNLRPLEISGDGRINSAIFSKGFVVWRRNSMDRATSVRGGSRVTNQFLGNEFYNYMMVESSCVIDVGEGRGFISQSA